MATTTHFQGPWHFPSQAGKRLSRAPFLAGTQKVYWGGGRQNANAAVAGVYGPPQSWPAAREPALVPRIVRYLPSSNTIGSAFDLAGIAVDTFVTDGVANLDFRNLYTNKSLDFAPVVNFQACGNTILPAVPQIVDLNSGDYYATDVLTVIMPDNAAFSGRYITFGGGPSAVINMANITTDANRVLAHAAQAPRAHVLAFVRDVYSPPFPPGAIGPLEVLSQNTTVQVWGTIFPSLLSTQYYFYGGVVDNQAKVGGIPIEVTIISYIQLHFGL